jgi:hypothetical protein
MKHTLTAANKHKITRLRIHQARNSPPGRLNSGVCLKQHLIAINTLYSYFFHLTLRLWRRHMGYGSVHDLLLHLFD